MRIRVKTLPLRVGVTRLTALVEYILTLWRGSGEQIGERERVLEIDRCNAILILTHALRKATVARLRFKIEPCVTDLLIKSGELSRLTKHFQGARGVPAAHRGAHNQSDRLHVGGSTLIGLFVLASSRFDTA